MGSKHDAFTLEENLVLSNEELTSNWSKLASLIYSFEKTNWTTARKKASSLLKENSAIDYIEAVRETVKEQSEPIEPTETTVKKTVESPKPVVTVPYAQKTVYEKNYDRLLKLSPDFELRFLDAQKKDIEIVGRSKKTGFMDLIFELLYIRKGLFYISLSHYYKQNGDMVPDPDMEIRVDIKNRMIEALAFQDAYHYSQVYEHKGDKVLLNTKEKKDQNDFLTQWLKNLIGSGHLIVWDEDEDKKKDEPESEFIDEYSKTVESEKSDNKQNVSEPRTIEKEEQGKTEPILEPMKEEPKKVKSETEYNKLVSFIIDFENDISKSDAEMKANELIEAEKEAYYVLYSIESQRKTHLQKIFTSNYKKLLLLVPDLAKRFLSQDDKELLISTRANFLPQYVISRGSDMKNGVMQFVFYQSQKDQKKGTLMISVDAKNKEAKVLIRSDNFNNMGDFSDIQDNTITESKYKANEWLDDWLIFVLTQKYFIKSKPELEPEQKIVEIPIITPLVEKTTEQKREEVLNVFKENANKIPHFEVGKVEYTSQHKNAGVTKKMINWVNKHQKGLVLKPKTEMNYNTISEVIDKLHHAEKPGMRLSKTGQIYYEGRSNRSDLTDTGL